MRRAQRVFVTRSLPGRGLERLAQAADCDVWEGGAPPTAEVLAARASGCDGLLCLLTDRIDRPLLTACPTLRVVSSCSVGVDHIDLQAATSLNVRVGYTPGVLVETTADLTWALMLATARRVVEADAFVRAGSWTPERRWEPDMLLGHDVSGATLGLVGLGAIGQAVARRARGFGMRTVGWTRSGRAVEGVEPRGLTDLLAESDFVSLHVALAAETRGLIGATEIASMKRSAYLINTARGGIVDEAALADALETGRIAGAALDVFADEPIDPQHRLLRAPNLVVTPHIGSASVATRTRMADLAVDNLLAGLSGSAMPHCANQA